MSLRFWKRVAFEALHPTFLVAKFFCFLHVTNTHLCTIFLMEGPSMLPTFNLHGDLVLADRISTRFGAVRAGDIVLVRSPESPRKIIAKRLVGMEGDRITYVVNPSQSAECGTAIVPKGHVWVEGDNIYNSRDSRNFGAIPYGLLQARVLWRCAYEETSHSLNCSILAKLGHDFRRYGPVRRLDHYLTQGVEYDETVGGKTS